MTEHDIRLIEIGEKAGAEKATKQIVEWLLKDGTRLDHESSDPEHEREHPLWWAADAIEAGEPFQ